MTEETHDAIANANLTALPRSANGKGKERERMMVQTKPFSCSRSAGHVNSDPKGSDDRPITFEKVSNYARIRKFLVYDQCSGLGFGFESCWY